MVPGITSGCGCGAANSGPVSTPWLGTVVASGPAPARGFSIPWWIWVFVIIFVVEW